MKLRLFLSIFLLMFASSVSAQAIMDTKYGQQQDPTNLSDQDKDLSENFVHEGKVQKVYVEECTVDDDTEDACLGAKADTKFMGMNSSMIGALSKAYAMFMGTAGGNLVKGSPKESKSDNSSTDNTNEVDSTQDSSSEETASKEENSKDSKSEKKEEQTDYCKYIPVATEAISMLNTQTEQKSINNLPTKADTHQRDSLLKAAANHESRAKTAKIQTTGWGAGAACYAGMMATGAASVTSKGNIMKLAASTLLTGFYMKQIKAHEEYAKKTKAIADKLPGKGDCNPITDKMCFCTEPSSKKRVDYKQYCEPEKGDHLVATTSERMTCIDNKMQDDPSCKCINTNTCIDKQVMSTISGMNGQSFLSSPAMKDFGSLASGELTSKSLSGAQNNLNNAIAKLRELDKKVSPENNTILTGAQKAEAGFLEDMGLPANIAQRIATTPLSAKAKENMGKFNGSFDRSKKNYSNYNSRRKKKDNVLTFSGGDGINSNNQRPKENKPDFMSRFMKKKKPKKNNQTVLKFAQQAENQAQISRNSNRQIFDIISRRYQVSGWKRLEYIK